MKMSSISYVLTLALARPAFLAATPAFAGDENPTESIFVVEVSNPATHTTAQLTNVISFRGLEAAYQLMRHEIVGSVARGRCSISELLPTAATSPDVLEAWATQGGARQISILLELQGSAPPYPTITFNDCRPVEWGIAMNQLSLIEGGATGTTGSTGPLATETMSVDWEGLTLTGFPAGTLPPPFGPTGSTGSTGSTGTVPSL